MYLNTFHAVLLSKKMIYTDQNMPQIVLIWTTH